MTEFSSKNIDNCLQEEIKKRRQAEAEILETKSLLNLALNATKIAIWDWNLIDRKSVV